MYTQYKARGGCSAMPSHPPPPLPPPESHSFLNSHKLYPLSYLKSHATTSTSTGRASKSKHTLLRQQKRNVLRRSRDARSARATAGEHSLHPSGGHKTFPSRRQRHGHHKKCGRTHAALGGAPKARLRAPQTSSSRQEQKALIPDP